VSSHKNSVIGHFSSEKTLLKSTFCHPIINQDTIHKAHKVLSILSEINLTTPLRSFLLTIFQIAQSQAFNASYHSTITLQIHSTVDLKTKEIHFLKSFQDSNKFDAESLKVREVCFDIFK
jgi:hypothetical protein